MKRGLSNQLEAGQQPEHRARGDDGGEHGDDCADQQHQREALHLGGGDGEQHEGRDRRDDVRVDDRMEALLVTGRDRGPGRFPGPHLFLDAFEDDDVRVGRDSDREDQAGEAGQRQRDVEDEDRRVHERDVDGEAGDGHDPEQPVEDDQEERDEEQADHRGRLRLLERVLAERGRDVSSLDLVEGDGERTGLQHECEVLRLAEVADVLDLRRAAADAVGEGGFVRVDLRPGSNLPVEHDGEVLRDAAEVAALPQPSGDVLEAVLPLARELHADDRLAELVEVVAGPDDLRWPPVISGIGFSALSG